MDDILRELFEFTVDTPNQTYPFKCELNKNIRLVKAILFTSDQEEMIYYRGKQRVELSGKEYFPQGYETKLLMCSINISPNNKYFKMGEGVKPGDGIVKLLYTDSDHPRASFNPYKIYLYVESELSQ